MAGFIAGFFSGLGLIAAIGAQNAFVLRQGLRREYVGIVVLICAVSDAALVAIGVAGAQMIATTLPGFQLIMLWGGVAFLTIYGALRFRAAWRGGEALRPTDGAPVSLTRVVAICLAFTWLNPHVYLDTVALLGALSLQYAPWQWAFGTGAIIASFVFFGALGYGARLFAPVLARPRAWVVLEVLIGVIMWGIAIKLVLRAVAL
ncbi:LysE/ArgO family amino acid transporter [Roseinatronobacter alkalisoli]|uniref:LysE/ArgO family amino acid transporter n=1 Tax=Roseinatronobacter alkalisoli TaxID=3028235 RepID=A0ABT5T5X7_9RHOB|nr:LysE/ArgO family amino acid transporter [Roseinatronobacter sp. HJB301]MDD7970515.1 LysE/ArgO family amino acid transporter [Roseinatronobacter sp. HJB301]